MAHGARGARGRDARGVATRVRGGPPVCQMKRVWRGRWLSAGPDGPHSGSRSGRAGPGTRTLSVGELSPDEEVLSHSPRMRDETDPRETRTRWDPATGLRGLRRRRGDQVSWSHRTVSCDILLVVHDGASHACTASIGDQAPTRHGPGPGGGLVHGGSVAGPWLVCARSWAPHTGAPARGTATLGVGLVVSGGYISHTGGVGRGSGHESGVRAGLVAPRRRPSPTHV